MLRKLAGFGVIYDTDPQARARASVSLAPHRGELGATQRPLPAHGRAHRRQLGLG